MISVLNFIECYFSENIHRKFKINNTSELSNLDEKTKNMLLKEEIKKKFLEDRKSDLFQ